MIIEATNTITTEYEVCDLCEKPVGRLDVRIKEEAYHSECRRYIEDPKRAIAELEDLLTRLKAREN